MKLTNGLELETVLAGALKFLRDSKSDDTKCKDVKGIHDYFLEKVGDYDLKNSIYLNILDKFVKRYKTQFPDEKLWEKKWYFPFGIGYPCDHIPLWFFNIAETGFINWGDLCNHKEWQYMWWDCRIKFVEDWLNDLKNNN
jgi:hypothetical protein